MQWITSTENKKIMYVHSEKEYIDILKQIADFLCEHETVISIKTHIE